MNCSSCSNENREGARFCEACGTALAAQCGSCGAELRESARFCDSCGTAVGAPSNTAAQGAASSAPTPRPAVPLPASLGEGRYEVKGFLGEGGRKRV